MLKKNKGVGWTNKMWDSSSAILNKRSKSSGVRKSHLQYNVYKNIRK